MKVIRKVEKQWEEICKNLQVGDEIEAGGDQWRVLAIEEGRALIWKHTGLEDEIVFSEKNSNDYEKSDIKKYLMEEFPKTAPEELLALACTDFDLLSIEEVEKYLPREIDRIATDKDGNTWWWWTRSANRTSSYYVWYVYASGSVDAGGAVRARRCAPSVWVKI